MNDIHRIGRRGEAIATRYLEQIGCRILTRNFRKGKAEIDIIAVEGDFLLAIEVKSRSDVRYGDPEYAIDTRKIELLGEAIGFFQELHDIRLQIRFDIVSVIFPAKGKPELQHLRDAFRL